jgi:hypothetical protein
MFTIVRAGRWLGAWVTTFTFVAAMAGCGSSDSDVNGTSDAQASDGQANDGPGNDAQRSDARADAQANDAQTNDAQGSDATGNDAQTNDAPTDDVQSNDAQVNDVQSDVQVDLCASVQCVAMDDCHVAGVCQPQTGQCTNPMKSDGVACGDDNNPCTTDVCAAGICTHPAGHAGTTCRASAGQCDVAEVCDGVSAACPADAKSTAVCRASAGQCDLADSCDGVGNDCPADAKSTAVCRPATGVCDASESCDGVSNDCPADAKAATCPVTYSCYCVAAACGNGAAGGDHLDVKTGISPADVVSVYGPDRIGSRATGWTCFVEAVDNVCACVGVGSLYACGNNAIGGNGGDSHTGISTSDAISSYGIGRVDTEATGWVATPSSY